MKLMDSPRCHGVLGSSDKAPHVCHSTASSDSGTGHSMRAFCSSLPRPEVYRALPHFSWLPSPFSSMESPLGRWQSSGSHLICARMGPGPRCHLDMSRKHLGLREVTLVPVRLENIRVPSKSVFEPGHGPLQRLLE